MQDRKVVSITNAPQATVSKMDGKGNLLDWKHPANAHVKIVNAVEGKVECSPKREKVAIVGYALSSRELAPFNDPEFEIWGENQLNRFIPRADRWFEMHVDWRDAVVEGTNHKEFVHGLPIPIYMPKLDPTVQSCVRYPIERIEAAFGIRYLTSTIAEMMALALLEGFKRIDLYGIDLAVGEEWFYQKPCAEFWLGMAHARGVHVNIPESSALLSSRFAYGYQDKDIPFSVKQFEDRLKKTREKMKEIKQGIDQAEAHYDTLNGAAQLLESLIYTQQLWERGADTSIF